MTESAQAPRQRRAPRHVKAAAKILQKEARRILRKQAARIPGQAADEIRASIAAIDTHRAGATIEALEDEAERLDELLHQHASFARKSALRETVENILIAVLVALGLRSCLYEPFKIPSGSMMPTLRAGDHIFVNKFTYGIQIPFTNTVVGKRDGDIERGDVIVFRYPLDETEDFIKRVIGLPGDEIKVTDRKVFLKRPGEARFERIERTPLKERCRDETGTKVVSNCRLYEEVLDGHVYTVRYTQGADRTDLAQHTQTWKVPEGHLLVMGDNRNQSHDSLAWVVNVEAVVADNLLSFKDLRDLTDESLFTVTRAPGVETSEDPSHDSVIYLADHRSPSHDLTLGIWHEPPVGVSAMYAAVVRSVAGAEPTTIDALLEGHKGRRGKDRDRIVAIGKGIDALTVAETDETWDVVALLESAEAVLQLQCGRKECKNRAELAARVAGAIAGFHRDHEQHARDILEGNPKIRYARHWTARGNPDDRLLRRRFGDPDDPVGQVDVILWRDPEEGVALLRDAVLALHGSDRDRASPNPDVEGEGWILPRPDGFGIMLVDEANDLLVSMACGRAICGTPNRAVTLANRIAPRLGPASRDRRKFDALIEADDVGREPVAAPRTGEYPYHRVALQGTVRGPSHSLELEVWYKPAAGLAATLAGVREAMPGLADDTSVADGGLYATTASGHAFAFALEPGEVVVRLHCSDGLCPDVETARNIARRAHDKAQDPGNMVDPDAERARPFVPRGNVKGRAERIWLPIERFWLEIK